MRGVHQGDAEGSLGFKGKTGRSIGAGLAYRGDLRYRAPRNKPISRGPVGVAPPKEVFMVKVIASSLRKGQVVEQDGKLYVVLTAENIHPGKGASVTQVDMRRITDGVKVSERWRTTEMVEKADVDEREYQFLYNDGEGYHFMEPTTYDQIAVPEDVIGDQK